jgi:hypothetical protein
VATTELTCERDRAPTRLTCCQCGTPICPQCLVRTPVGLKCETCAGTGAVSRRKRSQRWVVPAVLVGLVLALVVVPRLFADSEGDSQTEVVGPGPPNAEGPASFGYLGEEARDGDLSFRVISSDCGSTRVEGSTERLAQGKFCFLSLTIRNEGRGPSPLSGGLQSLVDGQNRRYSPDPAATAVHPSNVGRDLMDLVVNPGNQVQGVLVFDLPPDVQPQAVELRVSPRGRGAFVLLRPRA